MRFAIGATVAVAVVAMCLALVAGATTTQPVPPMQSLAISFDEVTVDSNGYTDVSSEVMVFGARPILGIRVCNTGDTNALDGFQLVMKIDPEQSTFDTWLSDTDFDTATSVLRSVSTTGPHEVAASSCAWAFVDTLGVYSIKAQASSATDPTTVEVDFTLGAG